MNDFWMYSTSTSMWTWKGGSNTVTQAGNYGTIGVASASNMPGCRVGGYTWIDANGFLWLFGGDGIGSVAASIGGLDDLWRYNVTTGQWTWIAGPSLVNLPSIYGSQNLASANNRVGGRNTGANWVDAGSNLWLFGGQGYATSASTNGKLNDLWRNANCLISPITMTIVAKDSSICAGESTSLTVSGSNNYIWAINSSTLDNIVITPSVTSVFSVTTQDSKGCTYTATFTEIVDACQNIVQQVAEQKLLFYPMPFRDYLHVNFSAEARGANLSIRSVTGQKIYETTVNASQMDIKFEGAKGLYFYELRNEGKLIKSGKLVKE